MMAAYSSEWSDHPYLAVMPFVLYHIGLATLSSVDTCLVTTAEVKRPVEKIVKRDARATANVDASASKLFVFNYS